MGVEASLLGQSTSYPKHYNPDILFPIARAESRRNYAGIPGIALGADWWHVFELSWLNQQGQPQVAIGRLQFSADAPFLIESKSLKLYFNSLNFHCFSSSQALITTVEHDLSRVSGSPVAMTLFDIDHFTTTTPHEAMPFAHCLDHQQIKTVSSEPDAGQLQFSSSTTDVVEHCYYSNLLRSNCPVTHQPDWGTVFIRYYGRSICPKALLTYIVSFREHDGFHEQCVERIFADIWQQLQPQKLMVYALYTRRGGLDINPCRVSDLNWLPTPFRLARQ